MSDRRSLRECLLESADDLESIVKQALEFLLERDKKKIGDESLTSLVYLFDAKQREIKEYLAKVEEYQNREILIRELEKCVDNRNEVIQEVEANLKAAEIALTSAVYQANKKVKSVRDAENRPVNSEEVIKLAHQISKSYSVAAPLYWQMGDPSRPFPTEPEFRNSALATPRSQSHAVPPALNMLRQPSQVRTPPQPGAVGRMNASPMQNNTWSPRTGYAPTSASPRGRGGTTPVNQRAVVGTGGPSPFGRRTTNTSPRVAPTVNIQSHPQRTRQVQEVSKVETMSSDSSSSSSSDEGES